MGMRTVEGCNTSGPEGLGAERRNTFSLQPPLALGQLAGWPVLPRAACPQAFPSS